MKDLSGKNLGRFQILDLLGSGGMSYVYRAYDPYLEKERAIKLIKRGSLNESEFAKIRERFFKEGKNIAILEHKNIVKVHELNEYDGEPYLVMDLIKGNNLSKWMGTKMTFAKTAAWLLPIADALSYTHKNNIIHRDVKPSNIIIQSNNVPILVDFGISRSIERNPDEPPLTQTGFIPGTVNYMPPEQALGEHIDARADEYALAVIFYELLSGKRLFSGKTPQSVYDQQINVPIPSLTDTISGTSRELDTVLRTALAVKKEDRYPSMSDFISALKKVPEYTQTLEQESIVPPDIFQETDKTISSSSDAAKTESVSDADNSRTILSESRKKLTEEKGPGVPPDKITPEAELSEMPHAEKDRRTDQSPVMEDNQEPDSIGEQKNDRGTLLINNPDAEPEKNKVPIQEKKTRSQKSAFWIIPFLALITVIILGWQYFGKNIGPFHLASIPPSQTEGESPRITNTLTLQTHTVLQSETSASIAGKIPSATNTQTAEPVYMETRELPSAQRIIHTPTPIYAIAHAPHDVGAPIRKTPGINSAQCGTLLNDGNSVLITGTEVAADGLDWISVRFKKIDCWVSKQLIQTVTPIPNGTFNPVFAVVKGSRNTYAEIYSEPIASDDFRSGAFQGGTGVEVITETRSEDGSRLVFARSANGTEGWILYADIRILETTDR